MILVQGTISISFNNNRDFPMPLNIHLPPQFPACPPTVQIPLASGTVIAPSAFLLENGTVVLQKVYPWTPQASLTLLASAIADTFSSTPPFAPAPPRPKLEFEIVQAEAESFVNSVNEQINSACDANAVALQTLAYHQSLIDVRADSEDTIAALGAVIESTPIPEAPPVEVSQNRLAEFESAARLGALAEAQAALLRAYSGGMISFDQMMKATREVARSHFQNTLYDVLQTG
jgi:hypothetical protein